LGDLPRLEAFDGDFDQDLEDLGDLENEFLALSSLSLSSSVKDLEDLGDVEKERADRSRGGKRSS
jgi:hypothetical protein